MNRINRFLQYSCIFAAGALLSVISGVIFYFSGLALAFPLPMAIVVIFFVLVGIPALFFSMPGKNYYLIGSVLAGLTIFFGGGFFHPPGNADPEYESRLAVVLSLQPFEDAIAILVVADTLTPLPEDLARLDWVASVDVVIPGARMEKSENRKIEYFDSLAKLNRDKFNLVVADSPLSATGQSILRGIAEGKIWAIPHKFAHTVLPDDLLLSGYWLVNGKNATDDVTKLSERLVFFDQALELIDLESLFAIIPTNTAEVGQNETFWSIPKFPRSQATIWVAGIITIIYFAAHIFFGGKGQGVYYFQSFENGATTMLLLCLMMTAAEEFRIFNYYYGGLAALSLLLICGGKKWPGGRLANIAAFLGVGFFFGVFPTQLLLVPLALLIALAGMVEASEIVENSGRRLRVGKFTLAGVMAGSVIFLLLFGCGASAWTIFWVALGLKSFYLLKT